MMGKSYRNIIKINDLFNHFREHNDVLFISFFKYGEKNIFFSANRVCKCHDRSYKETNCGIPVYRQNRVWKVTMNDSLSPFFREPNLNFCNHDMCLAR